MRINTPKFVAIAVVLLFTAVYVHTLLGNRCSVVVFIDDFSGLYPIGYQQDIIEILNRHETHATLFVIPNHNLEAPISGNPALVGLLAGSGLPLGMHGYRHYIGREGTEFQFLSREGSRAVLERGNAEFERAFGRNATLFRAPSMRINTEAKKAVLDLGMIDSSFLVPHEYSWYLAEESKAAALEAARSDLESDCRIRGHYILAAHVGAINNPPGLRFLDELLGGIDRATHMFISVDELIRSEFGDEN